MTWPRRSALVTLGALAGGGLAGCGSLFRPTPLKMEVLHDDSACPAQAPVLLVLLPGAHMTPAEMQAEGMVEALRQRRLAVDVVIAGAGLEYVYDGSIVERLRDDVIAPYRARGYRRLWLAGISLGAYVAMSYAVRNPGQVEGIVALAPYLGRHTLVQEVAAAGGVARWQVSAQPSGPDDVDHALWSWLATRSAGAPSLHLGYGSDDRFAQGHALLAQLLPPAQVQMVPGGHDWAPWRQLWTDWLDRDLLPRNCAT